MAANPVDEIPPDDESEEEFGLQQVKDILGFLFRAPRRHPWAAALTLVTILTLGTLAVMYWPRTYGADVRILAQSNVILPSNRRPEDTEGPTKNALDAITRRDNIVALIHELDLLNRWQTQRQPIMRLKDKIFGAIFAPPSEEIRMRDMIGVLGKKLQVSADESSVTISVEWPERVTAYEIVSQLQKNFLEARYDTGISVRTEAIRILEERSKPQALEVDAALEELTKCEAERNAAYFAASGGASPGPSAPVVQAPPRVVPRASSTSSTAAASGDSDIAQQLQEVRRKIQVVSDEHDRALLDAQRQLVDARATLGPMHPTVVALNDKISQLSEVPPELTALKSRQRALVAELAGASASTPTAPSPIPRMPTLTTPTPAPRPATLPSDIRDDSRTALARQRLQAASTKYDETLGKIEAARVELEVQRAAFKYQYIVVRPPEIARNPSKPNVLMLIVATVLLAALMTLLVPAAKDLLRGRFIEPWQVERGLKLPILGELTPPP
jgi:hypothetical protein